MAVPGDNFQANLKQMGTPMVWAKAVAIASVVIAAFIIGPAALAFVVGLVVSPNDAEGNAARGGQVVAKTVENELPLWTDPILLVFFGLMVALVALGLWLWGQMKSGSA